MSANASTISASRSSAVPSSRRAPAAQTVAPLPQAASPCSCSIVHLTKRTGGFACIRPGWCVICGQGLVAEEGDIKNH